MTIAEILVPLTGTPADAGALDAAFVLAAPSGAHVTALFAVEDAREAVSAQDLRESIPVRSVRHAGAREQARQAFAGAARKAGAAVDALVEKHGALSARILELPGDLAEAMAHAALFADLVVFPHDAARGPARAALIRVLTESEKPVLLAGRDPPAGAPRAIAIGWDGSLPAARALTAALPFLATAKSVELLTIGEPVGIAAAEAIDYLALQGVTASLRPLPPAPAGPALLAAARGADLLVLGAYGHNRLMERVFGGATAHVLAHAGQPVLLAH